MGDLHYYELCFYHDEDDVLATQDRCSYCIKTEIPPVIPEDVALKILFGDAPKEQEKTLMKNLTCIMEISWKFPKQKQSAVLIWMVSASVQNRISVCITLGKNEGSPYIWVSFLDWRDRVFNAIIRKQKQNNTGRNIIIFQKCNTANTVLYAINGTQGCIFLPKNETTYLLIRNC